MPRPKKCRRVHRPPHLIRFEPSEKNCKLSVCHLSLDEYEAVRLADYEKLDQETASQRMEISRPTFTRLVEEGRYKMAAFFVEGSILEIEGGKVHFCRNTYYCPNCGKKIVVPLQERIRICPFCGFDQLEDRARFYQSCRK